jgi:uncharacterized circularly permuted ATP-grasp superfamily protein
MTIRSPDRLLASYRPLPGAVDELVDDGGELRSHWARVGPALDELGLDELVRRRREAARLLTDDGVTYNVYADGPGSPAPWRLDPLPLLVSSDEWAAIERGVIQRSELLNLVLTDLYGPRDLLRRGVLPPEIVTHPGFVRARSGPHPRPDAALQLRVRPRVHPWRVPRLADRTQRPPAPVTARERVVVSHLPQPLPGRRGPPPRAVLPRCGVVAGSRTPSMTSAHRRASPGPWSETAFEHAYLAAYLGYTLVEGTDLTVRDGQVWLRSLGRLERVDVILRRVDASFCDPLELRPDSELGVPGLVGAARLGNVTIVNTLGSGVLENPGLLPFLPRLSEHLLGQPLRLPSVDTWWCGDETSRRHVLANLPNLGQADSARWRPVRPLRCGALGAGARRPGTRHRGPTAPLGRPGSSRSGGGTDAHRPRPRAPGGAPRSPSPAVSPTAMPGGWRVAPARGDSVVSNQAGALSKDTWCRPNPESLTGFWLQDGRPAAAVEPAGSMSARAAGNLFWLGRYAERAEAVVRLLRAVHDRRTEFERGLNPAGLECLRALVVALTHVTTTYPGFVGDGADERVDAPGPELHALEIDERRAGTLAHSLRRLLDAAHAVRDQLSGDTWIVIGSLDRSIPRPGDIRVDRRRGGQNSLNTVMTSLLALAGLGAESMVRDPGWYFMDAGRRIERAVQLAAPAGHRDRSAHGHRQPATRIRAHLGREHHHLSTSLSVPRATRDGAGSARARRRQPALARPPARPSHRRPRASAFCRAT